MLVGRRVVLQTVEGSHSEFLYYLSVDPAAAGNVKYHGSTPSPEQVSAELWFHVLAQFVVAGRASDEYLGLVVLSSPNFVDRYCHFSSVSVPRAHGTGLVMEAAILTLEYAFKTWDFRKVYLDVLDTNLPQFGGTLDRYACHEGTLREHQFLDGAYRDMHRYAIYADRWRSAARHLVAAVDGEAAG